MNYTKRQTLEILRSQLENEQASFLSHWRDLGDYILPLRPRFTVTDANRGDRKNQKIIDNTGTLAAGTLRSGMMSGVTSPARPWFRLTTPDPDLAEFGRVKEWLHLAQQRMSTSFLRSNLYNVLPTVYGDMGVFATGAMFVEEDFDGDVLRAYPIPIGSYKIAQNDKLKVNVFYREFRMTVRQLIDRFGKRGAGGEIDWSNFSTHVKYLYDTQMYETWIDIVHAITPNSDYDPRKLSAKNKKFYSCYYERGAIGSQQRPYLESENESRFLSEGGYDYFPVLCPRWETTGEDVYGTNCPGMVALGDIKQLQLGERRTMQAVEKMINPPMIGPTSLKNSKASVLPGDITYDDSMSGQGFRPAHEVNFRIQEMEMKQDQCRSRIQRAFYEDLFLMLANSDRRQITAREIEERHEEKLLALGPVLEQLNQDLLDPLIDIAFDMHLRQGLLPPPPEELQGMQLKVEYISMMAQAQKLVGIAGVERFVGFIGQMASFDPNVLLKVKSEQVADVYGDMTSVPPSIIRTDEEVEQLKAQIQQQQAQQQRMLAMEQMSKSAKNLAQSDLEGDNALNRMMEQVNGGGIGV